MPALRAMALNLSFEARLTTHGVRTGSTREPYGRRRTTVMVAIVAEHVRDVRSRIVSPLQSASLAISAPNTDRTLGWTSSASPSAVSGATAASLKRAKYT